MRNRSYLKKYEFNNYRIIGISSRFQIIDEGFCVSDPYKNLNEAEEALKKFVLKTLGMEYDSKVEL